MTNKIKESAIGKEINFGASRKMRVITERVVSNITMYSFVTLQGKRAIKTAVRYNDGRYKIID
jgi:hypothetical protein